MSQSQKHHLKQFSSQALNALYLGILGGKAENVSDAM